MNLFPSFAAATLAAAAFLLTSPATTARAAGDLAKPAAVADPLPSWNDGAAKRANVGFVDAVTDAKSPSHVPAPERVAVFDNDGMLWGEQPMLELLAYLRANGFRTFVVSGGGGEFLRVFAEQAYGVPPEQVVGSSIRVRYVPDRTQPHLDRLPEIDFLDDKTGKPVGIHSRIVRRPIAAFGNSDGDFEMLGWTTTGPGRRLGLLLHHDDAKREFAYDRHSAFGRLDRGLDEAAARGWIVAGMKDDWARVYPP